MVDDDDDGDVNRLLLAVWQTAQDLEEEVVLDCSNFKLSSEASSSSSAAG